MTATDAIRVVSAGWEAPAGVRAVTTLRAGGVSTGSYASLNLGTRGGDRPENVAENRRRLVSFLDLPGEPHWLRQVHGTRCVDLSRAAAAEEADGGYTDGPGRVCAVLTADCLPLFVCDPAGRRVGLFHVGWKGLAAGMVERALACFDDDRGVHCWLGPAIGPGAFEVGPEVRDALLRPGNELCFRPSSNAGRWMADLYALVAHRLDRAGVGRVSWDPDACTLSDAERFFSYRREQRSGRMASLIWIDRE